jgi:hypothetical protein
VALETAAVRTLSPTPINVDAINLNVTTANLTIGDLANNISGAGHLVSDDFESGNFSLWSGGSSGGASVDTSQRFPGGRYAGEINVSSSTGYARTGFSSSSTTFTLNTYFRFPHYQHGDRRDYGERG